MNEQEKLVSMVAKATTTCTQEELEKASKLYHIMSNWGSFELRNTIKALESLGGLLNTDEDNLRLKLAKDILNSR